MNLLAYIGIGTNIEPRMERMQEALSSLETVGALLKASSIYETSPYGVSEQPSFLNAVAAVATDLTASELHKRLKDLETKLGRQKRERWHEREIDFDILFYGDEVISSPELTIPHADLVNRSFVLIPLAEIAPNIVHPLKGETVEALAVPFRNLSEKAINKIGS